MISYVRAPRTLWNYPRKNFNIVEETIENIEVIEVTSYYSELNGYREIRNQSVLNIKIPTEAFPSIKD